MLCAVTLICFLFLILEWLLVGRDVIFIGFHFVFLSNICLRNFQDICGDAETYVVIRLVERGSLELLCSVFTEIYTLC